MTVGPDRWIRWTTIGCVALLALIAGTVSYLHMHLLVELHGQRRQPGGQCGRGRAKPGRARDRSVAVVRADRLL